MGHDIQVVGAIGGGAPDFRKIFLKLICLAVAPHRRGSASRAVPENFPGRVGRALQPRGGSSKAVPKNLGAAQAAPCNRGGADDLTKREVAGPAFGDFGKIFPKLICPGRTRQAGDQPSSSCPASSRNAGQVSQW